MELEDLISVMTPEIYQRLMLAVELGKWPDGVALTPEQKENSLQMVMLWQARHNKDATYEHWHRRPDSDENQARAEATIQSADTG
ncbi:protein YeaC [Yersinia enterocolitica]|uniref:Protein YeaC n=1 Tax=Yersinia enterocolitica TaxID=630 RepID=A0ABM9S978_YEREN|nr:protein YeaC [Yersinia enterocolitica]CNE50012.1 protein YeaC [Yersinia enterocolitica]CNF57722.1 protein YeaC [Yersinia enterocolitica]CNG31903.1 protein YeaC [Yersinia enterocolitica]CQD72518.1 protein YeaC [Yersinia enterocolitica]